MQLLVKNVTVLRKLVKLKEEEREKILQLNTQMHRNMLYVFKLFASP